MNPMIKRTHSQRGIALVLTLAILALVTILLIAFVVSMRVENTASKNFNDLMRARQLAQGAVDQAVSVIRNATPTATTTVTWVASPGKIITVVAGTPTNNYLYTVSTPANAGTVDLNTGYFITGSNRFYNSFANAAITAGWQNVTLTSGELIGRFAYWVDVDATKVNINSAKFRDSADTNTSNPTNVDLRALSLPFSNAPPASINTFWSLHTSPPGSPSFNTIEEMRVAWPGLMSSAGFQSNKFFVTVGTVDTNTDAFGRDRIDITQITNETSQAYLDAYARMSDDTWATMFYPGIVSSTRNTLQKKYGDFGVRQLLANIIEYQRPYVQFNPPAPTGNVPPGPGLDPLTQVPSKYSGLQRGPMINAVLVHVATNAVPAGVAGTTNLVVNVFVDVKFSNGYTNEVGGAKGAGNGYYIKADMGTITVQYSNPAGSFTSNSFATISQPLTKNMNETGYGLLGSTSASSPANPSTNVGTAPPPNFSVTIGGFPGAGPPVASLVTVYLKSLRFLSRDDPNYAVDWMIQTDFDTAYPSGMTFPNATLGGALVPYVPGAGSITTIPDFRNLGGSTLTFSPLAMVKQDVRVRTFPGWTAGSTDFANNGPNFQTNWWITGGQKVWSPGAINNGTFTSMLSPTVYGLLADLRFIEPGTGPYPVQSWLDPITNQTVVSLGELARIHTGYPWRTVRLRSVIPQTVPSSTPTPYQYADRAEPAPFDKPGLNGTAYGDPNVELGKGDVEKDALPDWILLDILTVRGTNTTTKTFQGRVNVNSKFAGAVSSTFSPRTPPVAALINNTSSNLSVAVNPAIVDSIASNIVSRVFVSGSPYDVLPVYFTPGEICEVLDHEYYSDPITGNATYDSRPSKLRRQQFMNRVANLVTARSSTFVVWCMAESIKEVGTPDGILNGQDFVTGQVKVQAIIQRYDDFSGGTPVVKFRTLYYRFVND